MHGNRLAADFFRTIFLTFLTLLWMLLIFHMSSAVEDESRVKDVADALGDSGRILVRESGTDPKIRVMVEAESVEVCEKYVDSMIEVIKAKGHVAEKKISLWSLKYGSGEYIRVRADGAGTAIADAGALLLPGPEGSPPDRIYDSGDSADTDGCILYDSDALHDILSR